MGRAGVVLDRADRAVHQVGRAALRWRTLRGVRARVLWLELLAVTLEAQGWRCVRLYRLEVLPVALLWVHDGNDADAGLAVTVLATGGGWYYADAGNLRERYLGPCTDRAGAAAVVGERLKWQVTTDTAPNGDGSGSAGTAAGGGCTR